jgi:hypothetical protein
MRVVLLPGSVRGSLGSDGARQRFSWNLRTHMVQARCTTRTDRYTTQGRAEMTVPPIVALVIF